MVVAARHAVSANLVLLKLELEGGEGANIIARLQLGPKLLQEVADDVLDVLLADEFHHLQHRAVQQVVPRPVLQVYLDHGLQEVVPDLQDDA